MSRAVELSFTLLLLAAAASSARPDTPPPTPDLKLFSQRHPVLYNYFKREIAIMKHNMTEQEIDFAKTYLQELTKGNSSQWINANMTQMLETPLGREIVKRFEPKFNDVRVRVPVNSQILYFQEWTRGDLAYSLVYMALEELYSNETELETYSYEPEPIEKPNARFFEKYFPDSYQYFKQSFDDIIRKLDESEIILGKRVLDACAKSSCGEGPNGIPKEVEDIVYSPEGRKVDKRLQPELNNMMKNMPSKTMAIVRSIDFSDLSTILIDIAHEEISKVPSPAYLSSGYGFAYQVHGKTQTFILCVFFILSNKLIIFL